MPEPASGIFITHVYNLKHPHSALEYLTPYGISTTNLLLTLLNFGPNKRWHFTLRQSFGNLSMEV